MTILLAIIFFYLFFKIFGLVLKLCGKVLGAVLGIAGFVISIALGIAGFGILLAILPIVIILGIALLVGLVAKVF